MAVEGIGADRKTNTYQSVGEVAEWLNAPHSKCGIRVTVSGVRIPPSPPAPPIVRHSRPRPDETQSRESAQAVARADADAESTERHVRSVTLAIRESHRDLGNGW